MNERVALVTGSSRGIGRAIALRLARDGFKVVVNDIKADENLQSVAREICEIGSECLAVEADVSRPEEVKSLFEKLVSAFGRLDVLVNNAGITRDGLLVRMSDADWHQTLDVNLTGTFLCTREAVRIMMKRREGRIINITSVVGIHGNAGQANYAAAKAGIIGFTKSVAEEYGGRGITVNAVAPGFIETEMTAHFSPEVRQAWLSKIPAGRAGTPDDVAAVVSFLASADAGYVNGQVIAVDGGMK